MEQHFHELDGEIYDSYELVFMKGGGANILVNIFSNYNISIGIIMNKYISFSLFFLFFFDKKIMMLANEKDYIIQKHKYFFLIMEDNMIMV